MGFPKCLDSEECLLLHTIINSEYCDKVFSIVLPFKKRWDHILNYVINYNKLTKFQINNVKKMLSKINQKDHESNDFELKRSKRIKLN